MSDQSRKQTSLELLDTLIEATLDKCLGWLSRDTQGNLVVLDPIENEPIYAHYAMSHLAAALVIRHEPGSKMFSTGLEILSGSLARWSSDSKLPSFHVDFNNMALCLIEKRLAELETSAELQSNIRATVLRSGDSDHDTINWLPMRVFVNSRRYDWTGMKEWKRAAQRSILKIEKATNSDGFVEDRLPRGTSFNLQYDASTVALLSFLNAEGYAFDLTSRLEALINSISPDGDINYSGRGANQIFCWGPWLYLLKSTGQNGAYDDAIRYLDHRLGLALDNVNILLNDRPGTQKDMWWDYHYASVYTAHLLLWMVLTRDVETKNDYREIAASSQYGSDSGVSIRRESDFFVVSISGRREYLAERGPIVAAVWTRSSGMIHKGEFGPWPKLFGNRYTASGTLLNHFGLFKFNATSLEPTFVPVDVRSDDDDILITYDCKRQRRHVMNLPLLEGANARYISLKADDEQVQLRHAGTIVTMYGIKTVLQSELKRARRWEVRIRR